MSSELVTGLPLVGEDFRLAETTSEFRQPDIVRLLGGRLAAFIARNALAEAECAILVDRFSKSLGRRPRPDGVPASSLGAYQYGKSFGEYELQVRETASYVSELIIGLRNPVDPVVSHVKTDDDGYLYIAGRKKDIISGGVNIYPAEVEAALDQSPDIYEVAVFGIPDEHWGESVHAAVVPSRPHVTESDVREFARAHLAAYKLPRTVSFVGALPKTGSGKVLKRVLRAQLCGEGDPC